MSLVIQAPNKPVLSPILQQQKNKLRYKKCILVICGVPLTGKSTLGATFGEISNFNIIDVDISRQFLFGVHGILPPQQEQQQMESSYAYNHKKAKQLLSKGRPVILIATYSREYYHIQLKHLAQETKSPLKIIELIASDQTIKDRLLQRNSDNFNFFSNIKTFKDYLEVKNRFTLIDGVAVLKIDTDHPVEKTFPQILDFLEDLRIK